jgi:hypothetical protein
MMIGYCGLDCEQCEAFIATRNNDDALRIKVAEEWARLYNAPIKPEHINCTGCQSAGVKTYYCDQMCETRKCATKKSVGTCADCSDYPCSVLNKILQTAPQAKTRLEALRKK